MTVLLCKFSSTFNSPTKFSDSFCIYSSNDFDNMPPEVRKVNKSRNAVVKVIGQNLPRLADWTIRFEGEWKHSKGYGYTFFASHYEPLTPSSLKGITRFLASKTFPGVGVKTAEAIVKEFKAETLDVIEKTPNLLLRVPGINIDKCGIIAECYQKNIAYSKLCSYLATYSISSSAASSVYESEKSLEDIRENPYVLLDVKGIGFTTCEKIARTEGVSLDSFARIEGAAKNVLTSDSEYAGNMFMLYEDFEQKTLQLLNSQLDPAPVSLERFRSCIRSIAKDGKVVFRGGKFIFLKEYDDAEEDSAEMIAKLLDPDNYMGHSLNRISDYLTDYCESSEVRLSDAQKTAVARSLMARLSIITGGPGTGKTTILKAIISVFRRIHPDDAITLLAPTGKAARRMTETSGYPAHTIHSELQIYEDMSSSRIMIDPGLIVVDETSMLDNLILAKLLGAIDPKRSQLIFIGDVNQLPSVGPGLVLKEMIGSGVIPKSELVEIFRQKDKASIVDNAYKVNHGRTDLICDESFQIVSVRNEEDAVNKIEEIYAEETDRWGIDNVALLSPLRRTQNRFTCVSDGLNQVLQNQVVPSSNASVTFNGREFRVGDRILQWKNTKASSNGDIGTITDIVQTDDGVFVKVKWENGNESEENRETMADITLAYSISIHKSQGSEYQCVIIPLISSQICSLFQKKLLYTGLTRSKSKIVIVSDGNKALDYCITHNGDQARKTLLGKRIRESVKAA
ncbi:MAG: AAA family ATPase [Erysipelotrichaceae bacterium]|nr:AAA family ATPase [Erysipelotrichaceae bacterium]